MSRRNHLPPTGHLGRLTFHVSDALWAGIPVARGCRYDIDSQLTSAGVLSGRRPRQLGWRRRPSEVSSP